MLMTNTAYPRLRSSLGAEYLDLSDEQLDAIVAEVYGPDVAAEDVESFWGDVGRGFQQVGRSVGNFARQAAPVVGRALPGIAQGAMTGAAVGGPFGAIAGAALGGAGGVLSQSRNPTLRGIGGAVGGATRLASGFTGGGALSNLANIGLGALGQRGGALGGIAGGALGALRGGGAAGTLGALGGLAGTALGALGRQGGAAGAVGRVAGALAPQIGAFAGARGSSANALLGMLARPETVRALSAAALGPYGRQQVMVGQQPVPVQSILNGLGQLAGRAAAEAESIGEAHPAYFYGADGELAIDPADPDQRLEALLELYAETPTPYLPALVREAEAVEWEPEYTDEDAYFDEWLVASEWAEEDEAYA